MSRLTPFVYGLLLHALPRNSRRHDGDEMAVAFAQCLRRERERSGVRGAVFAWMRGSVDILLACVAIRGTVGARAASRPWDPGRIQEEITW